MDKNIKILVAMHKKYQLPKDNIYLPIHVGKEGKDIELGIIGDNTGDNISSKNSNYCELTGLYWAWKNLEVDYIGLVHYRRYFCTHRKKQKFNSILNKEELEKLLETNDIIVPQKRNYFIETNESQYLHAHHHEGWEEMCDIIRTDYPDYVCALDEMRSSTSGHRFNMFIMKKEYFDAYCEWLFDILFKIENRVDISNYTVSEARIFGYLSERMLDVWLNTKSLGYKEIPVRFMEKQSWTKKGFNFLKRKFKH